MADGSVILKEDVQRALDSLDQKFISTVQRKKLVILLKSCPDFDSNLLTKLQASTYDVPYIAQAVKDAARAALLPLKESALSESLEDRLRNLSLSEQPLSSAKVFANITGLGRTRLRDAFWEKCLRAGAFQNAVYPEIERIVILGSKSDDDFWSALALALPIPSDVLQSIIIYHGNLEPPTITFEVGGNTFPSDIVDDKALQDIPDRLPSTPSLWSALASG
jgi:hypothetical protein